MKTKPKRRKTLRYKKLSSLLALALREVKRCEGMKNIKVDMRVWFKRNGKCSVCAAGAVMRNCLVLPRCSHIDPTDFDRETGDQLYAINLLRQGSAWLAGDQIGVFVSPNLNREVRDYDLDPAGWHADMKQLLADLRKAGC